MKKLLIILIISALLTSCSYTHSAQNVDLEQYNYSEELTDFSLPMFDESSVWNTKIPENASIDENSGRMIERLITNNKRGSDIVLSVHEWSCPAYFADQDTPRYDVELTNNWGLDYDYIIDVPIPYGAQADPEHDGHFSVIDESTGYVYEFWQFDGSDGYYSASWGNRISLSSDGIYPYGMSSRGSGFCVLAGMIWPQELAQGQINHALTLSIPNTKSGGPIPPATESDGRSRKDDAIPIGARLVLNPELDLDTLELNEYEKIICECLQTYGAIVGDTSASIEFEAINPICYPNDPYNGLFDERWTFLDGIPLEQLMVLETGTQDNDPILVVTDESIYR